MKVDVRNMLRQAAEILGKRRLAERERMFVGMYQFSLNELSQHLEDLASGQVTLDEFCEHYCLNRQAKKESITSIVQIQNPTMIEKSALSARPACKP